MMETVKKVNWLRLLASIIVCQAAGAIGSVFTVPSIPTWYASLVKPSFNPPSWVFGPVWTFLYLLMGISLYLVWEKIGKKGVKEALGVFGLQLLANAAWSIIFFGLKDISSALVEILILAALIIITIYKFYRVDRRAAYLLAPYLLWVTFASFLNLSLWSLNR
jgi:benzodiazapine receptor